MPMSFDISPSQASSCSHCVVRHSGICGALSEQQLEYLVSHTRTGLYSPGAQVFGDETAITSYASVVSGVIKLLKVLEDGRQQVVGLKFAPDFIGRVFATDNRLYAEAASPVQLCHIPRPVMERLLQQSRPLERRLMAEILRELDEAREWMVTLGQKSAAERVASFLHLIALHVRPDAAGCLGAVTYELPLTRGDIADFLGLSIETVSRQLTELRRCDIISIVNKRQVTIPDMVSLRRRCG